MATKKFQPEKWLDDEFGEEFFEKDWITKESTSKKINVKKTIIKALVLYSVLKKRDVNKQIGIVLKEYKVRAKALKKAGVKDFMQVALGDEKNLKRVLRNELVWSEGQKEISEHKGKKYKWLPSVAVHPRDEHRHLYGKIFNYGEGDDEGNMPTEAYGCLCGIEWMD